MDIIPGNDFQVQFYARVGSFELFDEVGAVHAGAAAFEPVGGVRTVLADDDVKGDVISEDCGRRTEYQRENHKQCKQFLHIFYSFFDTACIACRLLQMILKSIIAVFNKTVNFFDFQFRSV